MTGLGAAPVAYRKLFNGGGEPKGRLALAQQFSF